MDLSEYIRSECDRQHTTNYQEMSDAHSFAGLVPQKIHLDLEGLVCRLASTVEPEKNPVFGFSHNYRTSHVGFMFGGSACPAGEVPLRMERWAEIAEFVLDENYQCSVEDADSLIKTFLDIHPFVDGNGRVASILRNIMIGKLDDPEPLPYYYGEI